MKRRKKSKQCVIYRLYHGTDKSGFDCKSIEPYAPTYEGNLGEGMYFGRYKDTAEFYTGGHGKVCEYDVEICKPLSISPDNYETYRVPREVEEHMNETGGFDSILLGESIIPFDVKIKRKWHEVRNGSDLENIGYLAKEAGYDALIVSGIRERATVNEEVVVFDRKNIVEVVTA